jgi:hypothetical protein
MMTCKQAHRLLSQAQDRRLSWGERLGLRLHLLLCDACRRFSRQIDVLHQAMRRYARLDEAE